MAMRAVTCEVRRRRDSGMERVMLVRNVDPLCRNTTRDGVVTECCSMSQGSTSARRTGHSEARRVTDGGPDDRSQRRVAPVRSDRLPGRPSRQTPADRFVLNPVFLLDAGAHPPTLAITGALGSAIR
jgi:hypothetical protein